MTVIRGWGVAGALMLLAVQGCSQSCDKPPFYADKVDGRVLRVPEGLAQPPTTDTFAIPEGERPGTRPVGSCVNTPPKLAAMREAARPALPTNAAPAATAADSGPPPAAAEPVPQPRQEAAEPLFDGVRDMVAAWASAWANGDLDAYLDFYSVDFALPGDTGRAAWQDTHRQRMAVGVHSTVIIETLEVDGGDDNATATFAQRFEYQGQASEVRKRLTLARESAGWRIVEESVVEAL